MANGKAEGVATGENTEMELRIKNKRNTYAAKITDEREKIIGEI